MSFRGSLRSIIEATMIGMYVCIYIYIYVHVYVCTRVPSFCIRTPSPLELSFSELSGLRFRSEGRAQCFIQASFYHSLDMLGFRV